MREKTGKSQRAKLRRYVASFAAFMMAVLLVLPYAAEITTVYAANVVTIKLHYHREDGNYDGWDVWFWDEGYEGAGYAFAEEDGDMVATKDVTTGVSNVGFIVRTQDWTKDINADQFIDIAAVVSGTVHVYVESGVEGYTMKYADDVVTGIKIKTIEYDSDEKAVVVEFTSALESYSTSDFVIKSSDGNIAVSEIKEEGTASYLLVPETEMDVLRTYSLIYSDTEYSINMPIIYSTTEFEEKYTYTGDDLGATYSKDSTTFRVWAPTASAMKVNLYESGDNSKSDLIETLDMTADVNGTWVVTKDGDLNGTYYTFTATIDGSDVTACDPYARTTGVNGKRAMVIDLDSTDPEGWDEDTNPHAGENITDAVIYEVHIRDMSSDEDSGITNVGKYLSFTEKGTTTSSGISTGVDHIADLGVTHVHILPFYDFGSVDETGVGSNYNWGYDPVNYNVPEGSYSTDPYNGEVRVNEVKQLVMGLHESGLSVVMDVVYNHVYNAGEFCINKLVPGYFSRINSDGSYSNGSGCGNDTASERSMVRKYIVDSVCYWADEYHIDGFRFDLVGLLDVDTINEIVEEVHKTHPDVIFYGEGWTMSTNVTKDDIYLATQISSARTPEFAYFNDTIRDALKGSVFSTSETGYVSGSTGKENTIISSFMASMVWNKNPKQIINYASCHDNMTLFDRITSSRDDASEEDRIAMNNLAAAIYMTAEGVPFMMAGEEMLRSKVKSDGSFDSNSYASGDSVNAIDYNSLEDETYAAVNDYYKGLIAFRKAHASLRLTTKDEVKAAVTAVDKSTLDANVTAFEIAADVEGEDADSIFVIFNPNEESTTVAIPDGEWQVCINKTTAGCDAIETVSGGSVTVDPISALVLVKTTGDAEEDETTISDDTKESSVEDTEETKTAASESTARKGLPIPAIIGIIAGALALIGGAVAIILKHKK